jgi:hypothetical protein
MDIEKIFNEEINKQLSPEVIKPKIEKHVSSMVGDILESFFYSYGDIAKTVKEQMKEHIKIDLSRIDMSTYNTAMVNHIKEYVKKWETDEMQAAVEKMFKTLIHEVPKEAKLSTLIEDFINELHYDDDNITYCVVSIEENGTFNRYTVEVFDNDDKSYDEYKLTFTLSTLSSFSSNNNIFYAYFNRDQIERLLTIDNMKGWMGDLYGYIQANTDMKLDIYDGDKIYYEGHEEEEY